VTEDQVSTSQSCCLLTTVGARFSIFRFCCIIGGMELLCQPPLMFDEFFQTGADFLCDLKDPYLRKSYQYLKTLHERCPPEHLILLSESDVLLAYLWERTHDGKWLDVHPTYRYFYGYLSAIVGYFSWITSNCQNDVTFISRQFRLLDLGLLLGSPESFDTLHKVISLIHSSCTVVLPLTSIGNSSSQTQKKSTIPRILAQFRQSIPVEDCPNLLSFSSQYFSRNKPVVLRNCIQDWPALSLWTDLGYINSSEFHHIRPLLLLSLTTTSVVAGHRTVPIELGNNYLSESSGQKLMTMNEFLCGYILPRLPTTTPTSPSEEDICDHSNKRIKRSQAEDVSPSPPMGYLAQHCLFDHIPVLKSDFLIPDYCCLLSSEDEEDSDVIVNGWLGPIGTISPLHHDPYHNILAQVHGLSTLSLSFLFLHTGHKYVRLYSPNESDNLYPLEVATKMSNNSQIDLLNIQEDLYPKALQASYCDVILHPGDMLFIPR
jgi:[protein]-arginine 3-hydroxylase / protease